MYNHKELKNDWISCDHLGNSLLGINGGRSGGERSGGGGGGGGGDGGGGGGGGSSSDSNDGGGGNGGDDGGGGGDGGGGDGGGDDGERCGTSPSDIPINDLGVRFNKVIFPNDIQPPGADAILPLTANAFPICSNTTNVLRQSTCWSVIQESNCFRCDIPFSDLITSIGGLPKHPVRNDSNNDYWKELRDVILARNERLNNGSTEGLLGRVPALWSDYTLEDIAEAVHNEYPGEFGKYCIIFQAPSYLSYLSFILSNKRSKPSWFDCSIHWRRSSYG